MATTKTDTKRRITLGDLPEAPPILTADRVEALAAAYSARSEARDAQAKRMHLRGRRPEDIQAMQAEADWCARCADDIRGLLKPLPEPSATYCTKAKAHELIDERLRGGKYECVLCGYEPVVE